MHTVQEESSAFSSGIWLGQAVPDESLAPFCIPTNPIRWVACVMSPTTASDGVVFGAGFFDDAAEAQQRNGMLFFLLKGTATVDIEAPTKIKFQLVKQYEPLSGVETFPVTYSGVLDAADPEKELQGRWNNEGGGSFGHFRCRRTREAPSSSNLRFCRICDNALSSSEEDMRYVCYDCPSGWECCASCCDDGQATSRHCHELHAEQGVPPECAEGDSCRDIVLNALFRFASRPLIGEVVRSVGSESKSQPTLRWLSYEEIAKATRSLAVALQTAPTLQKADKKTIALIGNLTPEYVVVALASVLVGAVFVPLDPLLGEENISHCLKMVCANVVFADPSFQLLEGSLLIYFLFCFFSAHVWFFSFFFPFLTANT